MTDEAGLSLYGNAAGDWAFVESAPGLIPAPCFGDLRYLGHPDDAITSIYGMIPGHGKTGRGGGTRPSRCSPGSPALASRRSHGICG